MKKLILSAVFALACFTAQASSEVIKNDDKKPKAKKEVAKVEIEESKPELLGIGCTAYGFVSGMCGDEYVTSGTSFYSSNCSFANTGLQIKLYVAQMNLCN